MCFSSLRVIDVILISRSSSLPLPASSSSSIRSCLPSQEAVSSFAWDSVVAVVFAVAPSDPSLCNLPSLLQSLRFFVKKRSSSVCPEEGFGRRRLFHVACRFLSSAGCLLFRCDFHHRTTSTPYEAEGGWKRNEG